VRLRAATLFLAFAALAGGCDGTTEEPNPFQCIGLSSKRCQSLLVDAQSQVRGSTPVHAVIRCTKAICTDTDGEASVRVDFANGQVIDWVTTWTPAIPGGPVPVPEAVPVPVDPDPDPVESHGPSAPAPS
jgi:hypothetical protein